MYLIAKSTVSTLTSWTFREMQEKINSETILKIIQPWAMWKCLDMDHICVGEGKASLIAFSKTMAFQDSSRWAQEAFHCNFSLAGKRFESYLA